MMKELLEFCRDFWPLLVGGFVSACGALVTVITALKTKKFVDYMNNAKQRETYVECPRCKKKIPLSEINFHLPSGEIDNDLNGRPDHLEH